jgi:outer membrane protein OmpA-like peptidoglycan-associated protein
MNSDDATISGQAENRRVEINASTRQLLAPIETKRLEQTATPPRIKFYQDIFSGSGIRSNKIIIRQGGRILETIDGLSGDSRHEWLWNITQGDALNSKDSITWAMEVTDSSGGFATVSGSIRIKPQERTVTRATIDTTNADKLLERFHLLLFDYSSTSELGKNADEILNRIASAVTPDATVTLIGHTDITGDPAFNDKLSYDRASKASVLLSNKLRFLGRSSPSFDLEARGSKDILFDNTVPEGRMLSRTVRVTVERDLK